MAIQLASFGSPGHFFSASPAGVIGVKKSGAVACLVKWAHHLARYPSPAALNFPAESAQLARHELFYCDAERNGANFKLKINMRCILRINGVLLRRWRAGEMKRYFILPIIRNESRARRARRRSLSLSLSLSALQQKRNVFPYVVVTK
jgi:hypothetical protein